MSTTGKGTRGRRGGPGLVGWIGWGRTGGRWHARVLILGLSL